MSNLPTPKQIEAAIEALISQTEPLWNDVGRLQKRLQDNLSAIQSMIAAYKSLTGKLPKYNFPQLKELNPLITPNTKITDAIYSILKVAGEPKTKSEIIDKLRESGVKISLKTPRVVLNTAIKNDKGKRFKVLEDGRVDLVKVKKDFHIEPTETSKIRGY
jgi:hypothetical protein